MMTHAKVQGSCLVLTGNDEEVTWGPIESALLKRLAEEARKYQQGSLKGGRIYGQDVLEKGGVGFHKTRTAVRFSRHCLFCF